MGISGMAGMNNIKIKMDKTQTCRSTVTWLVPLNTPLTVGVVSSCLLGLVEVADAEVDVGGEGVVVRVNLYFSCTSLTVHITSECGQCITPPNPDTYQRKSTRYHHVIAQRSCWCTEYGGVMPWLAYRNVLAERAIIPDTLYHHLHYRVHTSAPIARSHSLRRILLLHTRYDDGYARDRLNTDGKISHLMLYAWYRPWLWEKFNNSEMWAVGNARWREREWVLDGVAGTEWE